MEVLTDEEPVYLYYTIVGNELENQNEIFYVGLDESSNTIFDSSENEPLQSLNSLGQLRNVELNFENDYTSDNGVIYSETSHEDEYYNVIKPTLINANYNEESIAEDSVETNTTTDALVQSTFSEDSNTTFDIWHSENSSSETNLSEDTKFECIYDGCKKSYATSFHLSAHMRTHVNPRPFACPLEGCDKKFASNFAMKCHVKGHTGERPYMCNYCFKAFKTSTEMVKHSRIHTGIKPFICSIEGCGRTFTSSSVLKVHIRSHTGERPYICNYSGCGKAFSSSSNQKNHMRIHSREKPFACTVEGCTKRFTEYSTMYKHMFSHQR